MKGQIKVGTYTGDGSVQNIEIGFIPDFLFIVNVTDGDYVSMWFNGMTDDTSVDIAAAVAANTADGIADYVGSVGANSKGFTVGTDASEASKVYYYFAVANQ